MNHEDQTHDEEITNPRRSQRRRNNKGSRKIKPRRSFPNKKDQSQTANIKQRRLNPKNEDRFQTTKIKP